MAPEVLFIERCIDWLKYGGRMGIVLPDGILGNPGDEYIRWWILRHCWVLASVDLPVEVFIVEANVNILTSLLFLKKKTRQQIQIEDLGSKTDYPVFMAVAEKVGYDRRGNTLNKRSPNGEELVEEVCETEWVRVGGKQVTRDLRRKRKIVEDDLPIGFSWPDRGLEGDDVRMWIQEVLRLRRSPADTQVEPLRRALAMVDGLIIAHQALLDRDFDSAARICEDLLRASPKHPAPARLSARAYEGRARGLWKVGRKGGAATTAARAVALDPNFPRAQATLGMICEDLGRTDEAVAAYRRAVTLNPLLDFAAERLLALCPQ